MAAVAAGPDLTTACALQGHVRVMQQRAGHLAGLAGGTNRWRGMDVEAKTVVQANTCILFLSRM